MNTRILQIRKHLNYTQEVFASKIGLTRTALSGMELGTAPITERTIITICSIFNVNEIWLKTGDGEMFNITDKKFEEFFDIYKNLNTVLQEYILNCSKQLLDAQNQLIK